MGRTWLLFVGLFVKPSSTNRMRIVHRIIVVCQSWSHRATIVVVTKMISFMFFVCAENRTKNDLAIVQKILEGAKINVEN